MSKMIGIGQLRKMSLDTYGDGSACDFQLARHVAHPLSQAWAFAHCDLAPNFG